MDVYAHLLFHHHGAQAWAPGFARRRRGPTEPPAESRPGWASLSGAGAEPGGKDTRPMRGPGSAELAAVDRMHAGVSLRVFRGNKPGGRAPLLTRTVCMGVASAGGGSQPVEQAAQLRPSSPSAPAAPQSWSAPKRSRSPATPGLPGWGEQSRSGSEGRRHVAPSLARIASRSDDAATAVQAHGAASRPWRRPGLRHSTRAAKRCGLTSVFTLHWKCRYRAFCARKGSPAARRARHKPGRATAAARPGPGRLAGRCARAWRQRCGPQVRWTGVCDGLHFFVA